MKKMMKKHMGKSMPKPTAKAEPMTSVKPGAKGVKKARKKGY